MIACLVEFVTFLLHPTYWLMNHPYDAEWDAELRWLLDNGYQFQPATQCTARIGDYLVWIANHPYASFEIDGVRPSRLTIMRAHRVLVLTCPTARFRSLHLRELGSAVDAVDPHA